MIIDNMKESIATCMCYPLPKWIANGQIMVHGGRAIKHVDMAVSSAAEKY